MNSADHQKSTESDRNRNLTEFSRLLARVLKTLQFTDHQIIQAIVKACEEENPKPVQRVLGGGGGTLGNVVRKWMSDPRFVNEDGKPKELSIHGRNGSFASLVKETLGESRNIKLCLVELIEMQAVALVGSSKVRCIRSYTVSLGHDQIFEEDVLEPLTELLRTTAYNLVQKVDKGKWGLFMRGVTGIEISEGEFPKLCQMVSLHGMEFLELIDAWAMQRSPQDQSSLKKTEGAVRPYIGVFMSAGCATSNRPRR